MKKVILILAVSMAITACKKKEIVCDSSCGTITNDGIDGTCYWLEVQNECSNNKKTFCFDESVWMTHYVGESFCVTNEPSW